MPGVEEIFHHKHVEENGDIIEMKILRVPKSQKQPEGICYSLVYIQNNIRLLGYDNFEGHGENLHHHRHVKDRIMPYDFIDEWQLIEDFVNDVEKIKRGVIQ